jgi:hypothetical protein
LTLVPLTPVIRYQDAPETALPAQAVFQLPPVTVATTVTLASVLIRDLAVALVEVLLRRYRLHAAYRITPEGARALNRPDAAYR